MDFVKTTIYRATKVGNPAPLSYGRVLYEQLNFEGEEWRRGEEG